MTFTPVFQAWGSIARLDRPIIVTRKIDGTNAAVGIYCDDGDYVVWAQSRSKIITPGKQTDNADFAKWVSENAETLIADLGEGLHFGEWWGSGIQRNYGKKEKYFSLFNTTRWGEASFTTPNLEVVEVLGTSDYFDRELIKDCLERLQMRSEETGFQEEGIVIFHTQGNLMFKKTIKDDDKGKNWGG